MMLTSGVVKIFNGGISGDWGWNPQIIPQKYFSNTRIFLENYTVIATVKLEATENSEIFVANLLNYKVIPRIYFQ